MSWINSDSQLLIKTDEAIAFANKNSLLTTREGSIAVFLNKNVFIKMYEERAYVHADYYDLKNLRWGRELQTDVVNKVIPSLEGRKKIYNRFSKEAGVLTGESMQRFRFLLFVIDNYMQDFLKGELNNYEKLLIPLSDSQKLEVIKLSNFFNQKSDNR